MAFSFNPADAAAVKAILAGKAPPAEPSQPIQSIDSYNPVVNDERTVANQENTERAAADDLVAGRITQDEYTARLGLTGLPPTVSGKKVDVLGNSGLVDSNFYNAPKQSTQVESSPPAEAPSAATPPGSPASVEAKPAAAGGSKKLTNDQAAAQLDKLSGGVEASRSVDGAPVSFGMGKGAGALAAAANGVRSGELTVQKEGSATAEQSTQGNSEGDYGTEADKLYKSMGAHASAAVDNQAAGEALQAAVKRKYETDLERETALHNQRVAEEEARVQEQRSKVDAIGEEVRKAELDKRSYLERNPFSGIALAIGAALGGALSARTGGPNQGIQTLERAIDRDLETQKYNIAKKKGDLDSANNLLSQNMKILGDQRLAYLATKQQLMDAATARIDTIASSTKSGVLKENAALVRDQWAKIALDKKMEYDTAMGQRALMMAAMRGQGGGKPADTGSQMFDSTERLKGHMYPTGLKDEHGLDIGVELDGSPEETKMIRKEIQTRQEVYRDLDELIAKTKLFESKKSVFSPLESDRLRDDIIGVISRMSSKNVGAEGGGAPAKYEIDEIKTGYGNPQSWVNLSGSKIPNLLAAATRAKSVMFQGLAGRPTVSYRVMPDGKIMARWHGTNFQQRKPLDVTPKQ